MRQNSYRPEEKARPLREATAYNRTPTPITRPALAQGTENKEKPKQDRSEKKRERKRPCRHCGGPHWDYECEKVTKTYQVDEDEEEGIDSGEEDVATTDLYHTDSESESEN